MLLVFYITFSLLINITLGLELPVNCKPGHYYDSSSLQCLSCPTNASMVTSSDGFGCVCDENSVRVGVARCRRCNNTEVLSADGTSCVPRRCQRDGAGRLACRKCPNDYIAVTQNFDGSPLKEVQCIKCSRGFKAVQGRCKKCEACLCSKNEAAVSGFCVPKTFLMARPKNEDNRIPPSALLDIVKLEYLCKAGDFRSCRILANECVLNLYSTERWGPCRLWIQTKPHIAPTDLPQLTLESTTDDMKVGEVLLSKGQDTLKITIVVHTTNGGMRLEESFAECVLPVSIKIGYDILRTCTFNLTDLLIKSFGETFTPYLDFNGKYKPLPVQIRLPEGNLVQKELWKSSNFRRYFLIAKSVSPADNITYVVFLRTFLIHLRVKLDNPRSGRLKVQILIEAQYATATLNTVSSRVTLKVDHELPSTGLLRALEIWGGVLGALSALYSVIQCRSVYKRGGLPISLAPILCGCVADALYGAALMASLHALASVASTTGLSLPLSSREESNIEAFIYSALSLKIVKVIWLNWNQCRCDVFLLDWSNYNPSVKNENSTGKDINLRTSILAREWLAVQTNRRTNPGFTVCIALINLQLLKPWSTYLPYSPGYHIFKAAIAWWSAYIIVFVSRWASNRLVDAPSETLLQICRATGVSLLVFQEKDYAHYVHGRNDDAADVRALTGPLSCCRVVCSPQLRLVYTQLSTRGLGNFVDTAGRRLLLTQFLAAFFERALDGLSWVASERGLLERLLDIELTARENGATSVLLYDPEPSTPSCLIMTWWCEEWNLAALDALLFSSTLLASGDEFLSAIVVLATWQIMKCLRQWFGTRNFKTKTEIDLFN